MAKKSEITSVKNKIWELCKQITRRKYGTTCYTCGATDLSGSNWQTAHFIPSSTCGAFLRYDLRNLRPCCYRCNINLGGNGAIYYRKMIEEVGQESVDKIFADKNLIIKADITFYGEKLRELESIWRDLEESTGTVKLLLRGTRRKK